MENTVKTENITTTEAPAMPTPRTTTRKIGGTTFVVSSSFNTTGSGDMVSKIARLIRDEADKGA